MGQFIINLLSRWFFAQLTLYNAYMHQDPLYSLTSDDRKLVWTYRHHLVSKYEYLPKFLQVMHYLRTRNIVNFII